MQTFCDRCASSEAHTATHCNTLQRTATPYFVRLRHSENTDLTKLKIRELTKLKTRVIFNLVSSRILNLMRSVFLKMSEAHILQNICTTLQLFCSKSKYSPVGMTQVQTRTHIYRSCRRLDLKSLDLEICRFFL